MIWLLIWVALMPVVGVVFGRVLHDCTKQLPRSRGFSSSRQIEGGE